MNLVDIVLVIVIVFFVFLALRKISRDRKNGSCCSGGCSQCSGCDKKEVIKKP